MDWMMPGTDGIELIKRIRSDCSEYLPYIIMLTSRSDNADAVRSLDAGANDYLVKPFDAEILKAKVAVGARVIKSVGDTEMLAHIFEESLNEIYLIDAKTYKFVFVNKAACQNSGYTREELKELFPHDLNAEFNSDELKKIIEPLRTGKKDKIVITTVHRRADNSRYNAEVHLQLVKFKEQSFLLVIVRDVTLQIETEEALRRSELKFRSLYDLSSDAVMLLDENGFFDCNAATLKIFNVKDKETFCGLHPADLSPPVQPCGTSSYELAARQIEIAIKNGSNRFDWTHKRYNSDSSFPAEVLLNTLELDGRAVVQAVVRDISKRITLQSQLANAHKMESVGQMAAGIAHEINTPAQYVGDNIRFLQDSFADIISVLNSYYKLFDKAKKEQLFLNFVSEIERIMEDADLDYLKEEIPTAISQSLDGIGRISSIVLAMKEFSHPGSRETTLTDINKALKTTITVSRNEWKYVAKTETVFNPELPMVNCFPGEINQVFLNIIVNAAHAIGEKFEQKEGKVEGVISITTDFDDEFVTICIKDNGPGIPENIRNRIFDPFFTTKGVGKGTGQGLAIARSNVVDKHNGKLLVESFMDKGTSFFIKLPLNTEMGEK
jgi:PAS domain S-box-containing protein